MNFLIYIFLPFASKVVAFGQLTGDSSHYSSQECLVLSCAAEQCTRNIFPNISRWYPWKSSQWSVYCAVPVQCGTPLMALVSQLPRSTGEVSALWCFPPDASSTAEALLEITLPKPV